MRQILFRGLDKTLKLWRLGDFVKSINGAYISAIRSIDGNYILHQVKRKTVGEFTGFKDTHGELIFEGDILLIHGGKTPVVFNTLTGAWVIEQGVTLAEVASYGTIVGNIHEGG